jgi:NAD(P)-dependent dehydrogenase (short-subunit alcohol dehydrogenase family)
VTGAGRGIGEGIALALAREGADIVVMDRNVEDANGVVKKIVSSGGKAIPFKADVTNKG